MPMTFFLPVSTYPDPTPTAGLLRAVDMAASLGGEVTALVHEVDIEEVRSAFAHMLIDVSAMIAAAEARSHAAAAELTAELEHLARRFRIPLTVRRARTRPDAAAALVASEARTFDCSLLMPARASDDQAAVAEAVLFQSGGPAWVFPDGEATAHLESAAVAWDGGRAAARAVRDAMPMLETVGHVTILCATDDKTIGPTSVGHLQDQLRHHGIDAEARLFTRAEQPVGAALQQAAIESGAGLMVMGAYGHSRVREFILGGATRGVLDDRRLPVFMSH
ncbi:universal stress protein [Devosia sp.]|uniref:universal stress protein n=1 Tax=Devosia sp. TaxID=1871048 RepID=UPI001AC22DCB|nr:universal stress protein [Devosia sp.]MBN9310721.1 universal stress protein [Devosia sp.]